MAAPSGAELNKVLRKDDFDDYYITCRGKHVTIKVNNLTTVQGQFDSIPAGQLVDTMPAEGFLGFFVRKDTAPEEIAFRNIEIKELPPSEPTKPVRVTDPVELAKLPNAADALKQADIPEIARAYIGRGDPAEIPPELVAVLGDARFRVSERQGPMCFSPDGKQIAVANDRGEIRFLDAQTGRLVRQITSPDAPRSGMTFSPDGRRLAGIRDGTFSVIDAETGRLIWKREPVEGSGVDLFTFSADGKSIFLSTTGSPAGLVRSVLPSLSKWDAETGKQTKYAWSVRSENTSTSSQNRTKSVELVGDGNCSFGTSPRSKTRSCSRLHGRRLVAFSPDRKHFAVAWTGSKEADRKVTIHDAKGALSTRSRQTERATRVHAGQQDARRHRRNLTCGPKDGREVVVE